MSLIQEALKRQQMEQEGKLPPPPPAPVPPKPGLYAPPPEAPPEPSAATPAPDAPLKKPAVLQRAKETAAHQEPAPVRITPTAAAGEIVHKHHVLPALAAVLLVLMLLTGSVIWALMVGLELAGIQPPWRKTPAPSEVPDVATAVVSPPIETPGTGTLPPLAERTPPPSTPATDIPGIAKETAMSATAPIGEPAITGIPPADAVAAAVPAPTPPPTAIPPPVAESPPPPVVATTAAPLSTATAPEPTTAAVPTTWPDLAISGVVGNQQKGAAFINGKVVGVNESILDVRVVAIRSQSVLLEYGGEIRLVKVGQPVNRR